MLDGEGTLLLDNFIHTVVGVCGAGEHAGGSDNGQAREVRTEVGLDLGEGHDGAVSAAAAELALPEQLGREADGVVEGQLDTGKGRCQCRGDGDQWSD